MTSLEQRYGAPRRPRRGWWALGIGAVVAVALIWMVWVTFGNPTIETRDITATVNSESREMTVSWSVTAQPGTRLACAVQALNRDFQVVGWKVVDIPASSEFTRQFSETFRTAMTPQTGLVYACWAS
jgi:hypothetical protein